MTARTLALSALILGFAFPGAALANPSMAGGGMGRGAEASFERMDTNKDGNATREEFFAAFPQMKEGAFTSIDKNGDGVISKEEWLAFAKGHASDEAAAHPAGEGGLPAGHPPMMGNTNGTGRPPMMKPQDGADHPPLMMPKDGAGRPPMPPAGEGMPPKRNGTAPAPAGQEPDLIMPSK